jgi:hypothetical protein
MGIGGGTIQAPAPPSRNLQMENKLKDKMMNKKYQYKELQLLSYPEYCKA